MTGLDRLRQERIDKVSQLRAKGINPYPYGYERTHRAQEIKDAFTNVEGQTVKIAGRLMAIRRHGQTTFADLADGAGRIQIYIRADRVGPDQYDVLNLLEPGDFIGVQGEVFKTRLGEITLNGDSFNLLAKAVRPLPDKWHGLQDVETRYRQRYIDLAMNPEVRQVFVTRTRIIQIIRRILDGKGFLEVETPTLQPLYGGASARPFVTFYNALGCNFYLRIANELYLKRLIVGGFEGVYEICKDFRNEGMDRTHNPEFTQIEFYWAYRDYHDMMDLTEEIFTTLAREIKGTMLIEWEGHQIDLTSPWPRRPMLELIAEYSGVSVKQLGDEALRQAVHSLYRQHLANDKEKLERVLADLPQLNRGNLIDELFELTVEPHLTGPIFVTDYPVEISPLAKVHRHDPTLTERFELFILGREMANSFSELNDPLDQRRRFEAQERLIQAGDQEAQPLDEDFLRAMEYGMPPTGGEGIGIDRLTMFFTNQSSIQDVILFPHMRPERSYARQETNIAGENAGEATNS